MTASAILLPKEVDEIVPISSTTRWRQEKRGKFPRRFKIAARKIGYHRSEIESWLADPEGWRPVSEVDDSHFKTPRSA